MTKQLSDFSSEERAVMDVLMQLKKCDDWIEVRSEINQMLAEIQDSETLLEIVDRPYTRKDPETIAEFLDDGYYEERQLDVAEGHFEKEWERKREMFDPELL